MEISGTQVASLARKDMYTYVIEIGFRIDSLPLFLLSLSSAAGWRVGYPGSESSQTVWGAPLW